MNIKALKTKKIGVLLGGKSAEREVSLKSGMAVYRALKAKKYRVAAIDTAGDVCSLLKRERIDIAFIVLHGGHGENGAIQGLLEVMRIPYTGSGVLASALAMDKEASKKAFLYHGVPVPPFKIVPSSEFKVPGLKKTGELKTQNLRLKTGFSLPWVVKPATEGSSVGVEIVKSRAAVAGALKKAFAYGDRVLVEQYIAGKEVQIGILNGKVLGGVEVKPSVEFYNYEAKYTSGMTEYILPPRLAVRTYEKAASAALAAHTALGCSGATRVDLIIAGVRPFVLEVNTIPGMTETSLLPKIAKHAGFDFVDLLEEILGGVTGAD
ncbi:MAG: D-alanine--D-alanine ligase [Nitrospiraceae bacterium]|nr:D-alanine--D-alanine ligase [Nitrospiraceae bacterium]